MRRERKSLTECRTFTRNLFGVSMKLFWSRVTQITKELERSLNGRGGVKR